MAVVTYAMPNAILLLPMQQLVPAPRQTWAIARAAGRASVRGAVAASASETVAAEASAAETMAAEASAAETIAAEALAAETVAAMRHVSCLARFLHHDFPWTGGYVGVLRTEDSVKAGSSDGAGAGAGASAGRGQHVRITAVRDEPLAGITMRMELHLMRGHDAAGRYAERHMGELLQQLQLRRLVMLPHRGVDELVAAGRCPEATRGWLRDLRGLLGEGALLEMSCSHPASTSAPPGFCLVFTLGACVVRTACMCRPADATEAARAMAFHVASSIAVCHALLLVRRTSMSAGAATALARGIGGARLAAFGVPWI